MAVNIGLDFGTTYSVVSRLSKVIRDSSGSVLDYELEACLLSEQDKTPCQDSIVLKKANGELEFGPLAKEGTGRKGTTLYKGFKMMLAENDAAVLEARGYDVEYTPKRIMEAYLSDLLQKYLRVNGEERIDKLVVGVPEIWFSEYETLDCRTALEDILEAFPFVERVELVSEPAAACAFFVENYKNIKNEKYKGKILLVDYGGGTLDIALCDVKENGQCSEISVIKRCGAGLNEEGYIGKAGLAFLEEIVQITLQRAGFSEQEILTNKKFYRCINSVETALMHKMDDIEANFCLGELIAREDMEDEFHIIEFDDEEYVITYGVLAKAYERIIRPVLDEKLEEMIRYMTDKGINFCAGTEDNFKIAMVGGFCNFFLTQEQIEQKFAKCAGDKRFSDIIRDRRECEKAISYGTTLIAENIIGFRQLAPYHLGIATGTENEIREVFYVVHKGDEIVHNEPMFIKCPDGSEMCFTGQSIPMLLINLTDDCDDSFAQWGEPQNRYKDDFKLEQDTYYRIGFSFDRSMILTLHLHCSEPKNPKVVSQKRPIRLNNIYDILGDLLKVRGLK